MKKTLLYFTLFLISGILIGFSIGTSWPSLFYVDHVTKIISALASFFGLVLGVFYYFAKINNDSEVSRVNRLRERFSSLREILSEIEIHYLDLLNLNIESQAQYETKRDILENHLDSIAQFIDGNEKLLGLPKTDQELFLAINSFYEDSSIIYKKNQLEDVKKIISESGSAGAKFHEKKEFLKYVRDARRICVFKSE